jgi:hypothetical protein
MKAIIESQSVAAEVTRLHYIFDFEVSLLTSAATVLKKYQPFAAGLSMKTKIEDEIRLRFASARRGWKMGVGGRDVALRRPDSAARCPYRSCSRFGENCVR